MVKPCSVSPLPGRPVNNAEQLLCCCIICCCCMLQAGLQQAVDDGLKEGWVPNGALKAMTVLQKALKTA